VSLQLQDYNLNIKTNPQKDPVEQTKTLIAHMAVGVFQFNQ
jgi:hypothetical protein